MINKKTPESQAKGQAVGSSSSVFGNKAKAGGGTALLAKSETEAEPGRGREEDESFDLSDLLLDEGDE